MTVEKSHKDFQQLIHSDLSEQKAIPVKSLNVGSDHETTTFKIVDDSSIQVPGFLKKWMQILKYQSWLFVLMPIFLVLTKTLVDVKFEDLNTFALAAVAALLTYIGLILRNDYIDYVTGADRVNAQNNKPVSQGWISALELKKLSWIFLVVGFAFSMPVYIVWPEEIWVVIAILVLAGASNIFKQNAYKFKMYFEFYLFLLMGPGLFAGLQVAAGGGIDTEVLALGVVWGWLVIFYLQIKNFENIISLAQMKVRNTITTLGFDQAKTFICVLWLSLVAVISIYRYFYAGTFWIFFCGALVIFWSLPALAKIQEMKTPMGSQLSAFSKMARRLILIFVFAWALEDSWYLLDHYHWLSIL